MNKYPLNLGLQLGFKFIESIDIRTPKTLNKILAKAQKHIQYEEKLANRKVIYGGVFENAKLEEAKLRRDDTGLKKKAEIKKKREPTEKVKRRQCQGTNTIHIQIL